MHSKGRVIDPSVSMFVDQFVNKSMSSMNDTGIMDILSIEQSMHLQYGYIMHNFLKDTFIIGLNVKVSFEVQYILLTEPGYLRPVQAKISEGLGHYHK